MTFAIQVCSSLYPAGVNGQNILYYQSLQKMLLPWIKHSEQILETLCDISLTEYHPSLQQHRESLGLHGLSLLRQSSSLATAAQIVQYS